MTLMPDCHKGQGRIPLLCGLYPNPYPEQWRVLRQVYGVQFAEALAAFPYVNLAILPGTAERYRQRYPELVEAGRIGLHEIEFAPQEQTAFFYRLLLSRGDRGQRQGADAGAERAGEHHRQPGGGAGPGAGVGGVQEGEAAGGGGGAGADQVHPAADQQDGRHLIDLLEDPAPLAVVLESDDLGPGLILPLEVAILSALSKRLRSGGNPLRWFIFHEMVKQLLHDIVAPYLIESGARGAARGVLVLVRDAADRVHAEAAGVAGDGDRAQPWGEPAGLSPRCRRCSRCSSRVPFRLIGGLPDRQAYMGFQRVSDPRLRGLAFPVRLRPSADLGRRRDHHREVGRAGPVGMTGACADLWIDAGTRRCEALALRRAVMGRSVLPEKRPGVDAGAASVLSAGVAASAPVPEAGPESGIWKSVQNPDRAAAGPLLVRPRCPLVTESMPTWHKGCSGCRPMCMPAGPTPGLCPPPS